MVSRDSKLCLCGVFSTVCRASFIIPRAACTRSAACCAVCVGVGCVASDGLRTGVRSPVLDSMCPALCAGFLSVSSFGCLEVSTGWNRAEFAGIPRLVKCCSNRISNASFVPPSGSPRWLHS
ncbi:Uncharacterized protein FWK35_00036833 [Aphis craccivora]|uniref:Uncharacterized protein n=1 Tax=Aphis craccivora TaxID=307492 RepID=A0A6G0VRP2_APHCR|nr:Uncharacterized protein FWK35_00036833 [Aphis craccivora]